MRQTIPWKHSHAIYSLKRFHIVYSCWSEAWGSFNSNFVSRLSELQVFNAADSCWNLLRLWIVRIIKSFRASTPYTEVSIYRLFAFCIYIIALQLECSIIGPPRVKLLTVWLLFQHLIFVDITFIGLQFWIRGCYYNLTATCDYTIILTISVGVIS